MKYIVQWNYRSSYGAFTEGETVDVTEEEAAAFNRDSPGVLQIEPETRIEPAPPYDRMVKTSQRRGSHD